MPNDQRVSKALMLKLLEGHQKGFVVDPFVTFSVLEWRRFPEKVLAGIRRKQLGPVLIVRSAALTEDSQDNMPPGTYHTELNVPLESDEKITSAVEKVISSYRRDMSGANASEINEVLIQRQVLSPQLSGLILSHEQNSAHPYYLVEYDDETGCTDTVTGGRFCKKAYIFRHGLRIPAPWNAIARAIRSVEQLLHFDNLVLEFALTRDGLVHVFQARRMPVIYQIEQPAVSGLVQKIRLTQGYLRSRPSAIWSNMADWNPAEMLGEHPRPLAFSLYRYLITRGTWARARVSLGYRETSQELIDDIAGYPYVNIEVSFASLCPAALSRSLARRLVETRIAFLRSHPELHDKVEFEVMFNCADVVSPARTQTLFEGGFSAPEISFIETALTSLTGSILSDFPALLAQDSRRRTKMMAWLQTSSLLEKPVGDPASLLNSILAGLEKCRDLGTFSFSRLSRLAFIARDMLGRLVIAGALSGNEFQRFWRSIETTASNVAAAVRDLSSGRISRSDFNRLYGHLRPHTYDITSPRYDRSELIGEPTAYAENRPDRQFLDFHPDVYLRTSKCLAAAGLPADAQKFFEFVSVSVQEREQSKFEFTSVLSACLEAISDLGAMLGLSRLQLAFLTIDDLVEAQSLKLPPPQLGQLWVEKIRQRSRDWQESERIRLPGLIAGPDDLAVVRPTLSQPNFITSGEAEGQITVLKGQPVSFGKLAGRIVVMEAADPGYDWIFSNPIAALVTKYGGVASHMAIRSAQFGIPAVIGCGDNLYNEFCRHRRARINCARREVEFLD